MNKRHLQDKHKIQLSLLISLFFHTIFLFFIIMYNRNTQDLKQTIFPEKPPKHDSEWTQTTARSAQTPVYFSNDNLPSNEPAQESLNEKETEKELEQPSIIEKAIDTQTTTMAQSHDKKSNIITNKTRNSYKQHTKQSSLFNSSSTKTPPSRSLPSLSQLTQGVMNYMEENGQHAVSMMGKKGTPTDEQLKYERYLERLNQCFHNSFAINSRKQPACNAPELPITVHLALNKDGTIYNLKLIKSCGNHQIDLFILYVLREASSSFPPVPHYLPHNPFSIYYTLSLKPLY